MFYRCCYRLARFSIGIFYPLRFEGAGKLPEAAALVCANHSSNIDPFFIAFAYGINRQVHIIAKVELFRIPLISQILRKLNMISVDRSKSDMITVKESLGYMKNGEAVAIFPEGTRAMEDDSVAAKSGAIKLAERAKAPLVPVFIPRKKPIFRRVVVKIGEPYYLPAQREKRTQEDYNILILELMKQIAELGGEPDPAGSAAP
ncbi:MAG: 1-acyl-sn-glycerol-3-phosphate acyltransferase [Oscillospiraceae bacterium]|nr:1-acyl-sn-glycerol-3-phosphate acyltransferase [Oscillospiraceae bacterium]